MQLSGWGFEGHIGSETTGGVLPVAARPPDTRRGRYTDAITPVLADELRGCKCPLLDVAAQLGE